MAFNVINQWLLLLLLLSLSRQGAQKAGMPIIDHKPSTSYTRSHNANYICNLWVHFLIRDVCSWCNIDGSLVSPCQSN